jgi:hypothetical protein
MFRAGEVVLIYHRNKPSLFARIEQVVRDKKKGWWQVTFLALALPYQAMTWILDEDQVCGAEFTIHGSSLRIERVKPAEDRKQKKIPEANAGTEGNVIPMFDNED